MESTRIDKWLWAARFFKTRTLATEEVDRRRVLVQGNPVKPAREVRVGDVLQIVQAGVPRTVVVRGISAQRGPAPVAALLYEETAESLEQRARAQELRRLQPEPAAALVHGRPTKRDRRALDRNWDERWSASIDPPLPRSR